MKTNLIVLAISILSIMSCAVSKSSNTASNNDALFSKNWQIVEVNGKAITSSDTGKKPHMSFDKTDMRYSAITDCNNLIGGIEIKNNMMSFTNGASTMMACTNMTLENSLKDILKNNTKFSLEGDKLVLWGSNNQALVVMTAIAK